MLTAPRRLGLEARLARVVGADAADEQTVLELALAGLRHVADCDDTVAAPFDVVTLTPRGAHWQVFDEPPPAPRLHLVSA